jgi:hypothetical protein
MPEYASSKVVYREIRAALDPWCKENGYRTVRGSGPCWVRPVNTSEDVSFRFRVNQWGSGATGGNSFHGTLELAPSQSIPGGAPIRQCDVSLCLLQSALDELRQIQTVINRRRPRTGELEAWMREDSAVGEHTREMYSGHEKPYQLGDFVTFGYYSLDDVRAHTDFLTRHIPDVAVRFVDVRCAAPKPKPMPPIFAKIYGTLNTPAT